MPYYSADYVVELAEALLTQVSTYFDPIENPGSLEVPGRRYVSGLEPAWDADQLVVWVDKVQPARLAHIGRSVGAGSADIGPSERIGSMLAISFQIDVMRACPQIGESGSIVYGLAYPEPDALDAFGRMLLADVWTVQHGLAQDQQAGTLFGDPPLIVDASSVIQPTKPLGPKSDLAGWRFSLVIGGA